MVQNNLHYYRGEDFSKKRVFNNTKKEKYLINFFDFLLLFLSS